MTKSRKTKGGAINGDAMETEEDGNPDIDSGHETAEEQMQVMDVQASSSRRGKKKVAKTSAATTNGEDEEIPMEEDADKDDDFVITSSAEDKLTESKTESNSSEPGRKSTVTVRREVVVSQTTSTPKITAKLKRTLEQIDELDKTEEVWEKRPKTDYTYSHTGIYMRHADAMELNGSETIIAYGGAYDENGPAPDDATTSTAALPNGGESDNISNDKKQTVKLLSSALKAGAKSSRSSKGGAWGKSASSTDVHQHGADISMNRSFGQLQDTTIGPDGKKIVSPNLSRRRLHKSYGLYSASNLRHLYSRCSLCALARQRFPGDDFGLDFHISHLQFYQPEVSDDEDDGERVPDVDLETLLKLSIEARQRIRASISSKATENSQRVSSNLWRSSSHAVASSEDVLKMRLVEGFEADVSDDEDSESKKQRKFSPSARYSVFSRLHSWLLNFLFLLVHFAGTLIKAVASVVFAPVFGAVWLIQRLSGANQSVGRNSSISSKGSSLLLLPIHLISSVIATLLRGATAACCSLAIGARHSCIAIVNSFKFCLTSMKAITDSVRRRFVGPAFCGFKRGSASVFSGILRPLSILYRFIIWILLLPVSAFVAVKDAWLRAPSVVTMLTFPAEWIKNKSCTTWTVFSEYCSSGLHNIYEVLKSTVTGVFSVFVGFIYYTYTFLFHFPALWIGEGLRRLAELCGYGGLTLWHWLCWLTKVAAVNVMSIVTWLATQLSFVAQNVVCAFKVIFIYLIYIVSAPFVALYRLFGFILKCFRTFPLKSSLVGILDGFINFFAGFFSFVFFVLSTCFNCVIVYPLTSLRSGVIATVSCVFNGATSGFRTVAQRVWTAICFLARSLMIQPLFCVVQFFKEEKWRASFIFCKRGAVGLCYLFIGLLYFLVQPLSWLWEIICLFGKISSGQGISRIGAGISRFLGFAIVKPLGSTWNLASHVASIILFSLTFPFRRCFAYLFLPKYVDFEEPDVTESFGNVSISSAPSKAKALLVGISDEEAVKIPVAVRTTRSEKIYYAADAETPLLPKRRVGWKAVCCWCLPFLLLLLLIFPLSGFLSDGEFSVTRTTSVLASRCADYIVTGKEAVSAWVLVAFETAKWLAISAFDLVCALVAKLGDFCSGSGFVGGIVGAFSRTKEATASGFTDCWQIGLGLGSRIKNGFSRFFLVVPSLSSEFSYYFSLICDFILQVMDRVSIGMSSLFGGVAYYCSSSGTILWRWLLAFGDMAAGWTLSGWSEIGQNLTGLVWLRDCAGSALSNFLLFVGQALYVGVIQGSSYIVSLMWMALRLIPAFFYSFWQVFMSVVPATQTTPEKDVIPIEAEPHLPNVKAASKETLVGAAVGAKCCGPSIDEIKSLIDSTTKNLIAARDAETAAAVAAAEFRLSSQFTTQIKNSVVAQRADESAPRGLTSSEVETLIGTALVREQVNWKATLEENKRAVQAAGARVEDIALQNERNSRLKEDIESALGARMKELESSLAKLSTVTKSSAEKESFANNKHVNEALADVKANLESLKSLQASLEASVGILKKQVDQIVVTSKNNDKSITNFNLDFRRVETQLTDLGSSIASLQQLQLSNEAQISSCCGKAESAIKLAAESDISANGQKISSVSNEDILKIVKGQLSSLYSDEGDANFRSYLTGILSSREEDLNLRLTALQTEIGASVASRIAESRSATEDAIASSADEVKLSCSRLIDESAKGAVAYVPESALNEEHVAAIVREHIRLFAADKTGKADYALESAGGSILSTRCSETYTSRSAMITLLGFPIWYSYNSPRTVIQPDVHPGQCWAFRGSEGFLVIQLAAQIFVTGFSYEHIPLAVSPSGLVDSAPKEFAVYGLADEHDTEGVSLGTFEYKIPPSSSEPLQHFSASSDSNKKFGVIELRILSNHGNSELTCLYRFRVHGRV